MLVSAHRSARSLLLCVGAALACSPSSDAPATRAALPLAATAAVWAQREQRRTVLDELAATLRERYVNPPLAEKAIAAVQDRWQSGAYDALTDDEAFAQAVSADLRAASGDQHLALELPRAASISATMTADARRRWRWWRATSSKGRRYCCCGWTGVTMARATSYGRSRS